MQSVGFRETTPSPSTRDSGVLSLEVLKVRHKSGNCFVEHLQCVVLYSEQRDVEMIWASIIPVLVTYSLKNTGNFNDLEVRRNIRVLWVVCAGCSRVG